MTAFLEQNTIRQKIGQFFEKQCGSFLIITPGHTAYDLAETCGLSLSSIHLLGLLLQSVLAESKWVEQKINSQESI